MTLTAPAKRLPAPRIVVLPHAIDRYVERVLRAKPLRPRDLELDRAAAAAIRAAIMHPASKVSRLMWRPQGWQRFVTIDGVQYVVREGMVVTVHTRESRRGDHAEI